MLNSSTDRPNAPFDVRLPFETHILNSLQYFTLSLLHSLPYFLKMTSNLQLQIPSLLRQVTLLGLKTIFLGHQIFTFLVYNMKKTLKVL